MKFYCLQEEGKATINLASKVVNFIRKSNIDSEILVKSVGFKIPVRNQTRWNSQYLMLSKFVEALELDPNLQLKLSAYKKHQKLGALETKMLKELILILEPFKEATDDFQADHESVGNAIPAYLDMRNKMSLNDQRNPLSPLVSRKTSAICSY